MDKLIFVGPIFLLHLFSYDPRGSVNAQVGLRNDQWFNLPGYLKHLPLFTRYLDLTSMVFRVLWAIF